MLASVQESPAGYCVLYFGLVWIRRLTTVSSLHYVDRWRQPSVGPAVMIELRIQTFRSDERLNFASYYNARNGINFVSRHRYNDRDVVHVIGAKYLQTPFAGGKKPAGKEACCSNPQNDVGTLCPILNTTETISLLRTT